MNAILARVFLNAAAMAAGLAQAADSPAQTSEAVAMTTLGATGPAGAAMARRLREAGFEPTIFHANGYGGAAFARFLGEGMAAGVIDLNPHELGRIHLAGAHVEMPRRFDAAKSLPQIWLPGALNFIGLERIETLAEDYQARPHYQHSGTFVHVKLTPDEMAAQATRLAGYMNAAEAPCQVIVPMGGFSHEDRPGGAIEDADLRGIFAEVVEAEAKAYSVTRLPSHINDPATAATVTENFLEIMSQRESHA